MNREWGGKKGIQMEFMPYWHMYVSFPKCVFVFASAKDLASFHPANDPIIFASHPPVTLNKQNLSMSNSPVRVVPYLTSLLVIAILPPTLTDIPSAAAL